jgi:hypothetical protein
MASFASTGLVYYITPLKADANQYSGYQLMLKIHELALGPIPIKVYRSDDGGKYIDTTVTCGKSELAGIDPFTDIPNMDCKALNKGYISSNLRKKETCAILEYKTVAGKTKLNTILVFGFNALENSIEIIALCSEGGGGTTFNYFLNLVKAALIEIDPHGRDFEPKIVLDALQGALRFYKLFGFTPAGPTISSLFPLSRKMSVKGSTTIKLEDIDNEAEALTIQRVISQKAEAAAPAQKRNRGERSDDTSNKNPTLGYGIYLGPDTAGGNMNKIKNKTINVLFRPFRILTKGSVKKSNKKRSKRRITNKRKTRKNN